MVLIDDMLVHKNIVVFALQTTVEAYGGSTGLLVPSMGVGMCDGEVVRELRCDEIVDKNWYLMEQRHNDDRAAAGLWIYPGGKIEEGETAVVALRREAYEELGIRIFGYSALRNFKFDSRLWNGSDVVYDIYPFLVTNWAGDVPRATLDTGTQLVWSSLRRGLDNDYPPVRIVAQNIDWLS